MMPRWLVRYRNQRAFDRARIDRRWARNAATAQGLDPDRVEFAARMLAADTDPTTAWRKAIDLYLREQQWMAAVRPDSCPTCDRLRHPSAAVEQHPYIQWLEATYRWEVESR